MFKFINVEMTPKKRERSECANILEVFDFVCHVCCVSWWKLDLFKVKKKDVCVRYNRISAYCVTTLCVLRTVLNPPEYCVPKGGGITLMQCGVQKLFSPRKLIRIVLNCKWYFYNTNIFIPVSLIFQFDLFASIHTNQGTCVLYVMVAAFLQEKFNNVGNQSWYNLSRYCHNSSLAVTPRKGSAVMWYSHFVDQEVHGLNNQSITRMLYVILFSFI